MLPKVVTIILTAGKSGRLGTHKALIRLNGKSAITRVIETSLKSMSNATIVVTGAQAAAITLEIQQLPVLAVENTNYFLGRTGSLKCALQFLLEHFDKKTKAFTWNHRNTTHFSLSPKKQPNSARQLNALSHLAIIIFPVDCPFVPSQVLDKLIQVLLSQLATRSRNLWITPEFKGRRGHPAVLCGPILSKVLELSNDFPLREFLHNEERSGSLHQLSVPVDTESVTDNINTLDDLNYVLKREDLT